MINGRFTPSQAIRAVSEAIFGCWCPSALADKLGVSERSMRRWGDSESGYVPPDGVWVNCVDLLNRRAAQMKGLVADLLLRRPAV